VKPFAERFPGETPSRGFVAPCAQCGALVVHVDSTQVPTHMHRRSKKCRDAAAARKGKA
jgi:hypothetical protein